MRDLLFAVRAWKRPEFPVGGDDALAAGLKGPEIGQALRKLEGPGSSGSTGTSGTGSGTGN